MVNYKQILADFASIAYHHEQIQSYGFGDYKQITNDLMTKLPTKFIRMYVVPGEGVLLENEVKHRFAVVIMDKVEDDLSNLEDVLSDTLEICKDIWTVFYQSYTSQNGNFSFELQPDQLPEIVPFTEQYDEIVAGFTMNLSISYPFDYNGCTPPMDPGFELPADGRFDSYKLITDTLKLFADLHEQVNSYGFGDIQQITNDILTKQTPLWPRMYVLPSDVQIQQGLINLSFQIYFLDITDDDLTNQEDNLNDTIEIAKDLFAKLYFSEYEANWNATIEPVLQAFETNVSGCVMNITIEQNSDYNRCVLPLSNFSPNLTWDEVDRLWKKVREQWNKI
jgi:hypothetical protein